MIVCRVMNSLKVMQMVQPYRVFISVKILITEHAGLRINTFLNRTDVSKSTLNNLEKPRPTSPATVSNVEIAFNAALEERRQPKFAPTK